MVKKIEMGEEGKREEGKEGLFLHVDHLRGCMQK